MKAKARGICDEYTEKGCHAANCPLSKACAPKVGDDRDIWAERVNGAAEEVEEVG